MSPDAVSNLGDAAHLKRRREALRLACAVSFCFVLAEVLRWDATFLGPLLAAQLLVSLKVRPPLAQGVGIVIIISAAMAGVFYVSASLVNNPVSLLLCLGLLHYLAFYVHLRGAPEFPTLMLQLAGVAMPVFVVASPTLAADLAMTLIVAGAVAVGTVWAAYAAFPPLDDDEAPVLARESETVEAAVLLALEKTAILMPVLAWFVLDASQNVIVILVMILNLLRLADPRMGWKTALALIAANFIGGVAAVLTYTIIDVGDNLAILATVMLGTSLLFAGRIVSARELSPVFVVAFATFILLLGLGLSPMPGGNEEAALARLTNVVLATIYAAGALTLCQSLRAARSTPVISGS